MLIPRFTLRWLLLLTTACGGLSLVLSYAVQGNSGAIAFSLALGMIPLLLLLHAATFSVAWLISQGLNFTASRLRPTPARSPFAASGPPKQIVPPGEIE
jgi:hypothetical protein